MAHDLAAVIGPDGWASWAALTRRVDRTTVSRWVAAGRLLRLQPGIYALPGAAPDWRLRLEAAVHATGGVVSHRSALALWELVPPGGPIHLTVDLTRSARGTAGVVLHRTRELRESIRHLDGLPVSCPERAVVDTWGRPEGVPPADIRAAAIEAVRTRLCRPSELLDEVTRRPCLRRRGDLLQLVALLADGCRSELEIWGCLNVLRGPGMPAFTLQHPVAVDGQRFLLDAACEEVELAVELDGAAWHGSRPQRERDIRRDALLASIGWQTLRFSYRRMTAATTDCRRDILAVYTARRRLFGLDGVR